MHPVHVMVFIALEPAFPTGNAQFPLKMDFRYCAFKGDFEPETSVYSGQQLLGREAVLGF